MLNLIWIQGLWGDQHEQEQPERNGVMHKEFAQPSSTSTIEKHKQIEKRNKLWKGRKTGVSSAWTTIKLDHTTQ